MFFLITLPFDYTALEPYISRETISFHYGKHHQTYLDNLNKLTEGTVYKDKSLEEVVILSEKENQTAIFNNAAQVFNHNFYWKSLTPKNNHTQPSEALLKQIQKDFTSVDNLKQAIKDSGLTQFGSGWTWLVFNLKEKKLEVIKTSNAQTPLTSPNLVPLLTLDVWEHAYYLDYQNKRAQYLEDLLNNILNWNFANENYNKIAVLN